MFGILKTNKGDFIFVEECGGAERKKWGCRKKQPNEKHLKSTIDLKPNPRSPL